MKKGMFIGSVVVFAVFFALSPIYAQGMGPGAMAPGYGAGPQGQGLSGGGYCPWCGQSYGPGGYGMGPGMMGPGMMGRGYGMGPGMMGPGYGMGPGMMGPGYGMGPGMMGPGYGMGPQYGPRYQQPTKPMEEKDAKEILENYLRSSRNPNLKLGDIEDKGSFFEAEIVTKKEGSLVDKLAVDKFTGWMRSVY